MPGCVNPKWYYQLDENFRVRLQAKNQLHTPSPPSLNAFPDILQKDTNFLFWVLWACLVAHALKTSMFICMPKINIIIHFFFEILHFKESCNFLAKNGFSWIKGFCQFLDIPIIYCRPKIRKNYWVIYEKKAKLTDGQTDRQTDRQTENIDFIGPPIGWGSNSGRERREQNMQQYKPNARVIFNKRFTNDAWQGKCGKLISLWN